MSVSILAAVIRRLGSWKWRCENWVRHECFTAAMLREEVFHPSWARSRRLDSAEEKQQILGLNLRRLMMPILSAKGVRL